MADTLMKRKKPYLSLPQDDDDDAMINILMRLPFESVLALKRVSKRWKNLINSPKFYSFYHHKTLAIVSNYDQLYYLSNTQTNKASVTVEGGRGPPFTLRRITIESIPRNSFILTNQLVTCNGIVCVKAANGDFVLYNLFTGASNTAGQDPRTIYHTGSCFGFGYDGYEDDYKILVACCYELGKLWEYKLLKEGNGPFWVYSLRSRVWRRLEGFPYRGYDWDSYTVRLHPCSLKGVLHWGLSARVDPIKSKPLIVTYDLHTSRFGEISVPDGYANRSANVCDLGGQLCCWDIKSEAEYHVWVMKEYGVSESWTMLFSIGGSRIQRRCVAPAALYEGRDGRKMVALVCRTKGWLYWYDIHNDKLGGIGQCVRT